MNKEWIYGLHAVSELLRQHPQDVLELLLLQGRDDKRVNEVKSLASAAGVQWQELERRDLDRRLRNLPSGAVHQGV
ncbi:MAG: 23S rRNA (guanosine(2251)-2'-O)-methyltransferase RlmB, partial [Pseudomonadales bacterium]|nr:23S rRNA (guanosine(2251)-2'-O)-methyltransferase RlmB [Pseudomonadales bacterium]